MRDVVAGWVASHVHEHLCKRVHNLRDVRRDVAAKAPVLLDLLGAVVGERLLQTVVAHLREELDGWCAWKGLPRAWLWAWARHDRTMLR